MQRTDSGKTRGACVDGGSFTRERMEMSGYREFNEFPLSELSRSTAAFANNPILEQEFKRAELESGG